MLELCQILSINLFLPDIFSSMIEFNNARFSSTMLDIMPESHYARSSIHYASMVTRLDHTQISDLMCIASLFCISVYYCVSWANNNF